MRVTADERARDRSGTGSAVVFVWLRCLRCGHKLARGGDRVALAAAAAGADVELFCRGCKHVMYVVLR